MASKIFLDTDVIIDFLIDRQPHAISASRIFDLADRRKLTICTSVVSINNIHYIVRKVLGEKKSREVIDELLEILEVLSVSNEDVKNAIKSKFKDFEDAVQYSVALKEKSIHAIITRNVKDYKSSDISVFNSDDFIKMIKNER